MACFEFVCVGGGAWVIHGTTIVDVRQERVSGCEPLEGA